MKRGAAGNVGIWEVLKGPARYAWPLTSAPHEVCTSARTTVTRGRVLHSRYSLCEGRGAHFLGDRRTKGARNTAFYHICRVVIVSNTRGRVPT